MSRTGGKGSALQQPANTERVVRIEVQRRHAKGTVRVIESMIREIDDQLLYVSQFKKEWLQHRRELEAARQEIISEERTVRIETEQKCLNTLAQIARGTFPSTRCERSTSGSF